MEAIVLREFGGPDVLRLESVDTPRPGPGEVLVRVLAAGVNRLEDYLRAGSVVPLAFPHVLGSDAAGEVAAVGDGVTRFAPGDRVIPLPGFPLDAREHEIRPISAAPSYAIAGIARWGTYAQLCVVPERWLLRDETGLDPEQVAALPMPLLTAMRAVATVGDVKRGDAVLVHAGASGTGSMNVQVARALGARVATTIRGAAQRELAAGLGADLVIDTEQRDFVAATREWTHGRGVDVVVDNLGGDVLPRSLAALRPLGTLVAMGFVAGLEVKFHVRDFFFAQKQIRGTLMGDVEDLERGLALVKAGLIRPLVDEIFPLRAAADAHRRLGLGQMRGNLVLRP